MPIQSLLLVWKVLILLIEIRKSFDGSFDGNRNFYLSHDYFLYYSTVDAQKIFEDAQELNMTGKGYVWIVTEQALEARNVPLGTLGLQLQHATDEKKHIHDSL